MRPLAAVFATALSFCAGVFAASFLTGCSAPVARDEVLVEVAPAAASPLPFENVVVALSWKIVVDPGVPEWRAEETQGALLDWQAASPCPVSFEVVRAPVTRVDYMDRLLNHFDYSVLPAPLPGTIEVGMASELPDGSTGWGEWYVSWGNRLGSRVAYLETENRDDFRRVARHELGHAFGLPHNDLDPSVMCSSGCVREVEIMPADVAAFALLWCPTIP